MIEEPHPKIIFTARSSQSDEPIFFQAGGDGEHDVHAGAEYGEMNGISSANVQAYLRDSPLKLLTV